jgi:hypothetical protein
MPYKTKKLKSGKYQVSGPSGVHMKGGSKKNMEAQLRLLHGVDSGKWKPDKKKRKGIPER